MEGLKLIADYEVVVCSRISAARVSGPTALVIVGRHSRQNHYGATGSRRADPNVLRVERALERCVKQQPPQRYMTLRCRLPSTWERAMPAVHVGEIAQPAALGGCVPTVAGWVYVKGVFNQGLDNRRAREWPGALKELDYDACAGGSGGAALVALGWQSWRLNSASHTIERSARR